MKRLFTILLILLILSATAHARAPKYINGQVDRVIDGDTIVVRDGKNLRNIRLHNIDCPELKGRWKEQPYAKEATAFAVKFVGKREVTVMVYGHDRYGRILGDVIVNGRSLGRELVRAGLAHRSRYTPRDKDITRLEARARKAKRGLWKQDDPVTPYEHRRAGRLARRVKSRL